MTTMTTRDPHIAEAAERNVKARPGQRFQMHGWVPARVVTGKINKRGEVLIRFDRGIGDKWFPAEKVQAAIDKEPQP